MTPKEEAVNTFVKALDDHIREVVLSMTRESDNDCPFITRERVREALLGALNTTSEEG